MRGKSVLRWAGALALLVSAREVVDEPPYADARSLSAADAAALASALRALRARLAAATSSEDAASREAGGGGDDEQSDDDDEKSGARAHGARAHAHGALRALKVLLAPGTAPNTSKAD